MTFKERGWWWWLSLVGRGDKWQFSVTNSKNRSSFPPLPTYASNRAQCIQSGPLHRHTERKEGIYGFAIVKYCPHRAERDPPPPRIVRTPFTEALLER